MDVGLVLVFVLLLAVPVLVWLHARGEDGWADVERTESGAPIARRHRYVLTQSGRRANRQEVVMTWWEVRELAAEKSVGLPVHRDVWVARETEGGAVKRWMWRRGRLIRHWTDHAPL
ncbi:hypothetical protein ACQP1V_16075 [Microtetraspora malaysiensis]|uniref:hypothetical protein n=1 Tax=Microtetraspora malaysiensis TaxID=161358 RepID=UPI003D8CB65F